MRTADTHLTDEHTSAQRFALVRRLADDLAHELKNPLNAVIINLEVLRTRVRGGNTEGALERLDVVGDEVRRLHTLLDHVLRLVRPDSGNSTFALAELLEEVDSIGGVLAKVSRKTLELEAFDPECVVLGRREALRFALLAVTEALLEGTVEGGAAVRLRAEPHSGTVRLLFSAPAPASETLPPALEFATALLGEDGVEVAWTADEDEVVVRLEVPRAAPARVQ